jgi:hypothetical protein
VQVSDIFIVPILRYGYDESVPFIIIAGKEQQTDLKLLQ